MDFLYYLRGAGIRSGSNLGRGDASRKEDDTAAVSERPALEDGEDSCRVLVLASTAAAVARFALMAQRRADILAAKKGTKE